MGGKTVRREPLVMEVSDRAREILVRARWISYFTRFQRPSEEITIEFLQHLKNGQSMVRGRRIIVSDAVIAEVSGMLAKGEVWSKKNIMLHDAVEIFRDAGQELTKKGKGIQPSSLGEPWGELARFVHRYITCDGRQDVVRPHQLKLLVVLNQKFTVNLPSLLNSLLHDTTDRIRWAQRRDIVVSHRCLIRLIVSHNLAQQNLTWNDLIMALESGQGFLAQSSATLELSQQNPVPKRKKIAPSKSRPHKLRWPAKLNPVQSMPEGP